MCAPDGLPTWRQLGPVALTAPPTHVALAGMALRPAALWSLRHPFPCYLPLILPCTHPHSV
jgi:hypothetical protein